MNLYLYVAVQQKIRYRQGGQSGATDLGEDSTRPLPSDVENVKFTGPSIVEGNLIHNERIFFWWHRFLKGLKSVTRHASCFK